MWRRPWKCLILVCLSHLFSDLPPPRRSEYKLQRIFRDLSHFLSRQYYASGSFNYSPTEKKTENCKRLSSHFVYRSLPPPTRFSDTVINVPSFRRGFGKCSSVESVTAHKHKHFGRRVCYLTGSPPPTPTLRILSGRRWRQRSLVLVFRAPRKPSIFPHFQFSSTVIFRSIVFVFLRQLTIFLFSLLSPSLLGMMVATAGRNKFS